MHHIAGDLNSPQNLYLPSILKSFSKIWEQVTTLKTIWKRNIIVYSRASKSARTGWT